MKKVAVFLICLGALLLLAPAARAAEAPQITALTAEAHSITIAWSGDAPRYEVRRSIRRDGIYAKIAETAESTYKDTGLLQNGVYFYRVRALNGDGAPAGFFSEAAGQCCVSMVAAYAAQNPCFRQGKTITVSGLMLHSVGCAQERAEAFAEVWNRPDSDVLVHAVIEPTGNVWQLADWNLHCWHCGGSGNGSLIGVEMTEPEELEYLSGTEFSWGGAAQQKAAANYNTAVALFANLCFRYGLDPATQILSHREGAALGIASGHSDPEHLWSGLGLPLSMDTFRADVAKKMAGEYRDRSVPLTGHTVTVTAEALNLRSAPDGDSAILGTLPRGAETTVTEAKRAGGLVWGRCSAGGWIALFYTES